MDLHCITTAVSNSDTNQYRKKLHRVLLLVSDVRKCFEIYQLYVGYLILKNETKINLFIHRVVVIIIAYLICPPPSPFTFHSLLFETAALKNFMMICT